MTPSHAVASSPTWLHDGRFDAALATIASRAAAHDRDGSFPYDGLALLDEIGVTRLTAPVEAGGDGAGVLLACRVLERIAGADASLGLVMLWHLFFLAELAHPAHGWPAAARDAVLGSLSAGHSLINAIHVEPDLGSPARGGLPATRAVRQADGSWRLSGRKIYATAIPALRWILVGASIEDGGEPRWGRFLVDAAHGEGLRIDETWDHMGMRASASHDAVFEDAPVPAGHLVFEYFPDGKAPAPAWKMARQCTLVAAVYQGIAEASRDWLVGYLNDRVPSNLGASLATLPRFQAAVGQIELWVATSDRLLLDTATALDGDDPAEHRRAAAFAPMLKHLVTGNAILVASSAVELTGNPGASRHQPAERHLRDALTGRIHTPQSDVVLAVAGKSALAKKPS